jgi:hypothetical protein
MIWFDYDIERYCISCSSLRMVSYLFQEKTSFHDYKRRSLLSDYGLCSCEETEQRVPLSSSHSGIWTETIHTLLNPASSIVDPDRIKVIRWIRIRIRINLQMTS